MIKTIPKEVQNFIDSYFKLKINGVEIITPYFINLGGFLRPPVNAGKGTPEEIQNEVLKILCQNGENNDDLLAFLKSNGIGIDCSGLVYNIYDFWLKSVGKKSLRDFLPTVSPLNLRKYLSRKIKPQNSIGADEMTKEPFSQKIDVSKIQPGDLIRTKSGKHVLFITEVEFNSANKPVKAKYVQSSRWHEPNGMKYGIIDFDHNSTSLNNAVWLDNDGLKEDKITEEGFREGINTNGVYRPNLPILNS